MSVEDCVVINEANRRAKDKLFSLILLINYLNNEIAF